ncbi:hypothetical protein [Bosea sp. 117]|nr:hypothetical protein [Bosea sp. 117]
MTNHNAGNERLKHRYRIWLADSGGYSPDTIDYALTAIHTFETFNR